MPKKTKKSKVKKTRKIARKTIKKSAKKPAKKKTVRKITAKKKTARKTAKKSAVKPPMIAKTARPPMKPKPPAVPVAAEQRVGLVTHYYSHLSVAVVKLDQGSLRVGDSIHIKGHTTDLQQRVDSMQVEHLSIQSADVGQEFGLKVSDHVREHDIVYKAIG